MSGRLYFCGVERMRQLAREICAPRAETRNGVQGFIDEWVNIQVLRKGRGDTLDVTAPPGGMVRQMALAIGANLHAEGIKGIGFHNQFQRRLAQRGKNFGLKGWVECGASCDDQAGVEQRGRMDVVWAVKRAPLVLFEIDSTVKPKSLWKLKQGEGAAKYWIYFGRDVWAFKTFLKREDKEGEITGICVPWTFAPKFIHVKHADFEPPSAAPPALGGCGTRAVGGNEMVSGAEQRIQPWKPEQIICGQRPPDAAHDVQVNVGPRDNISHRREEANVFEEPRCGEADRCRHPMSLKRCDPKAPPTDDIFQLAYRPPTK